MRTQGVLNASALVIDVLHSFFPLSIDVLKREGALFDGPPIILIESSDPRTLHHLFAAGGEGGGGGEAGSLGEAAVETSSQIDFGAHSVVLLRDGEAGRRRLPLSLLERQVVTMTVPQAKGLEFGDGERGRGDGWRGTDVGWVGTWALRPRNGCLLAPQH